MRWGACRGPRMPWRPRRQRPAARREAPAEPAARDARERGAAGQQRRRAPPPRGRSTPQERLQRASCPEEKIAQEHEVHRPPRRGSPTTATIACVLGFSQSSCSRRLPGGEAERAPCVRRLKPGEPRREEVLEEAEADAPEGAGRLAAAHRRRAATKRAGGPGRTPGSRRRRRRVVCSTTRAEGASRPAEPESHASPLRPGGPVTTQTSSSRSRRRVGRHLDALEELPAPV